MPAPQVQALFPAGVSAAQLRGPGDPALLHPQEAACVTRAVEKRVQEFAAGRLCARLAMASLGVHDFPLVAAEDRQPVWPDEIVGSISHTQGLCIAVTAAGSRFMALGVDCEVVLHVTEELWPSILTRQEAARLELQASDLRPAAAALLFCAKEAFYKCQYPLTHEWLDFHDLDVEIVHPGETQGEFAVTATRPLALGRMVGGAVKGRYFLDQGVMIAALALPRQGAQ